MIPNIIHPALIAHHGSTRYSDGEQCVATAILLSRVSLAGRRRLSEELAQLPWVETLPGR